MASSFPPLSKLTGRALQNICGIIAKFTSVLVLINDLRSARPPATIGCRSLTLLACMPFQAWPDYRDFLDRPFQADVLGPCVPDSSITADSMWLPVSNEELVWIYSISWWRNALKVGISAGTFDSFHEDPAFLPFTVARHRNRRKPARPSRRGSSSLIFGIRLVGPKPRCFHSETRSTIARLLGKAISVATPAGLDRGKLNSSCRIHSSRWVMASWVYEPRHDRGRRSGKTGVTILLTVTVHAIPLRPAQSPDRRPSSKYLIRRTSLPFSL